jgi:hypothetical protein
VRIAKRDFGITISETNAKFILKSLGGQFYYHLPTLFPKAEERRPGNAAALKRLLERTDQMLIEPGRLDEILTDGRVMAGKLDDINELLETRRSGKKEEDRTEAQRELTTKLAAWGMTLASVDALLKKERKKKLDITDLTDLRMADWRKRGLAHTFGDVVAHQLCIDAGITGNARSQAVGFLTKNTDAFVFIWSAMQEGYLPVVNFDDALTISRTNIQTHRGQVTKQKTFESILRKNLEKQGLYLKVAIKQNSLLGNLDRRALANPEFRNELRGLIKKYRYNASALAAFNKFNILDSEEIYGDVTALAAKIAVDPKKALTEARKSGFVGPAMLAQADPKIRKRPDLVKFVNEHSTAKAGIMRWITDTEGPRISQGKITPRHITDLTKILDSLRGNAAIAAMSATELYKPGKIPTGELVRQTEYFKTGLKAWRGVTPLEVKRRIEAKAAAARKAKRRLTPAQIRARKIEAERRARFPRKAGFEAATPRKTEEVKTISAKVIGATLPQELRDFVDGALQVADKEKEIEAGFMMANKRVQAALASKFLNDPQKLRSFVYSTIYRMCERVFSGKPANWAARDKKLLDSFGIRIGKTKENTMRVSFTISRRSRQGIQTLILGMLR